MADAAAVAQAVFPSRSSDTRPRAVVLVDQDDWRAGIAAAQLTAPPLRAPVLLSESDEMPEATADALEKLRPTGAREAGGAQVIRIGDVAAPDGVKTTDVATGEPAATARAIDRLQSAAAKGPSRSVLVASSDRPDFAMPAAAWAAKSGDPVLWTGRDALPGRHPHRDRRPQAAADLRARAPGRDLRRGVRRAEEARDGASGSQAPTP